MKRSRINEAIAEASLAFQTHHWHLPPGAKWDVTGFGLGRFDELGLVLVNLTDLPEYCEKLMFARGNQMTPMHCHRNKQEDIICRVGTVAIRLAGRDENWKIRRTGDAVRTLVNGEERMVEPGTLLFLNAGDRITLFPGVYHEFRPVGCPAIIGEVSTANDDAHDNFFEDPEIGRYEAVEEDEPALFPLLSD